jgi:hypothetical protein
MTRFRSTEKPITVGVVRRVASLLSLAAMLLARVSGADPPVTVAPSDPSSVPNVGAASGTAGSNAPLVDTTPAPTGSSFFPEAPPEAPPPLPRKKGLVLETRLGALAFLGKFNTVAPPGPWIQTQLGYEFFKWLMVYGYGELAFTGTSNEANETAEIYFPVYGFGGGLRFTVHVTDRVALFLQGNAGAMSAIVPRDSLAFIGFGNAETLGFATGGRLGVEWYQIDRHMALSLGVGLRDAFNFKIEFGSDVPLMLDAGAALRYTF